MSRGKERTLNNALHKIIDMQLERALETQEAALYIVLHSDKHLNVLSSDLMLGKNVVLVFSIEETNYLVRCTKTMRQIAYAHCSRLNYRAGGISNAADYFVEWHNQEESPFFNRTPILDGVFLFDVLPELIGDICETFADGKKRYNTNRTQYIKPKKVFVSGLSSAEAGWLVREYSNYRFIFQNNNPLEAIEIAHVVANINSLETIRLIKKQMARKRRSVKKEGGEIEDTDV